MASCYSCCAHSLPGPWYLSYLFIIFRLIVILLRLDIKVSYTNLVLVQLSVQLMFIVPLRLLLLLYCNILQYFHYFILYTALYCYITLVFCGLFEHLLVQTMPWCPLSWLTGILTD